MDRLRLVNGVRSVGGKRGACQCGVLGGGLDASGTWQHGPAVIGNHVNTRPGALLLAAAQARQRHEPDH